MAASNPLVNTLRWAALAVIPTIGLIALTFNVEQAAASNPGPPIIEHAAVYNVGSETAELKARISTGEADTTYRFEYGPTTLYESRAPAVPEDIGSGAETVSVGQILSGLVPGTVYHYRLVAKSPNGEAATNDTTFLTFNAQESAVLPDSRAYELVSPPDKNGGDVGYLGHINAQAALNGEAVTYASFSSFGTSQSAEALSQYISTRTSQGWTTQGISPPANPTANIQLALPYEAFSADLSAGVLTWSDPTLTSNAPMGVRNLYRRDNTNGTYQLITTVAAPNGSEPRFVGASSDYDHIIFQLDDALTKEAVPNAQNLYEWTGGEISLVSIPPGGFTGIPGAGAGDGGTNTQGAISNDGSLIFFNSEGQLYAREDGTHTVKINASQRTPSLGDGNARFIGATPDGAHVLFLDETPLTSAANDNGGLYEFETASGELTDLTPDGAGNPLVQGVLGYSDDGSTVYFVATGELATGAIMGQSNLYLMRDGKLTFIATLSAEDSADWSGEPTVRHAEVTPNGEYAVFMSNANLTGYNNTDAYTGNADSEVFEYDAAAARVWCVSCNPSREAPIGPASVPTGLNANYDPRYLSEGGKRVFFDSADSLIPSDTNGKQDVYEWEQGGECTRPEGCIYLISSGSGETEAVFADASPSGNDVFFTTESHLVPEDTDENVDLYDARVNGGFLGPPVPAHCSGEACQGPLSSSPSLPGAPTALLSPQEETDEGVHLQPMFTVTLVGGRAAGRLLKAGKLMLAVRVLKAGTITVSATSRIRGHAVRIARTSVNAKPGTVTLTLKLARVARIALERHHIVKANINVSFTGSQSPRQLQVILRSGGPL